MLNIGLCTLACGGQFPSDKVWQQRSVCPYPKGCALRLKARLAANALVQRLQARHHTGVPAPARSRRPLAASGVGPAARSECRVQDFLGRQRPGDAITLCRRGTNRISTRRSNAAAMSKGSPSRMSAGAPDLIQVRDRAESTGRKW